MSSELASQVAPQMPPPPQIPPPDPKGIWSRLKDGFLWLVTFPSRLSTAAKAAWVLFFVLVALVVVAWTLFYLDENNVPWRHLISWQWVSLVAALSIVTPLVAYRGLRLWLEGDASLFPEVDYAWKAGLEALEQHGIDIAGTPIYLLVGSTGEEQEAAMLNAAGKRLRVSGVPEGPAPLHWYANPDAIYLFATEASWLSGLASLKERNLDSGRPWPQITPVAEMPASVAAAEPTAPGPAPSPSPAAGPAQTPRGTIMLDQFVSAEAAAEPEPDEPPSLRGTMQLQPEGVASRPTPAASETMQTSSRLTMAGDFGAAGPTDLQGPTVLPANEASKRSQQLEYLCQLLSRVRDPICPVNGVVTLLPFELVKGPPAETEQLQSAVRSDLQVLHRGLKLRFPVTALVSGMERERGFRELVRRVGREMASGQRFGQKFDVCQTTDGEQMAALSAHVCGAFEDWVYTLFRQEDALTRAGNTRLYGLLCKVRCMLKTRLMQILQGGFGHDPQRPGAAPALSGCYFAATGPTPDKQAFVRGIFDKLDEEQELVEWSDASLAQSQWHRFLARTGIALTVAMSILAILAIVTKSA